MTVETETNKTEEKKMEIHLEGGHDSDYPTDPKAQRLKSWANIIATTAALLGAVVALYKPQDQSVNKVSYEQLKSEIEHVNADVKQNHDDIVALHNYLLGYFAGDSFSLPPLSTPKSIVISNPDAGVKPAPITVKEVKAIASVLAKDAGTPSTITFVVPTAESNSPFPEVHKPTHREPLPSFETIESKSKK